MKILLRLLLILIVSILGFLGYASTKPDEFRVSRSQTISAPIDVVFGYVDNLRQFNMWNPWADIDPKAKITFEGPESGEGASMHWHGNAEIGKGGMTNMQSNPGQNVRFKMEFLEPMESVSTAEFTFSTEGDATVVNWAMYGENNLISKAIGILFDCEAMIGEQFEKGLSKLKMLAEADAQKATEEAPTTDATPEESSAE